MAKQRNTTLIGYFWSHETSYRRIEPPILDTQRIHLRIDQPTRQFPFPSIHTRVSNFTVRERCINLNGGHDRKEGSLLSPSWAVSRPFLLRSRCVRARVTSSRRGVPNGRRMGRLVTGCTAATEQSRTDPSLVFVPTDLSILARCVTNVYVTTPPGDEERRQRTRKKRKETGRQKGRKEERWKNCGERKRTEAEDSRSQDKSNSTELLLSEGRTLTGAAPWRAARACARVQVSDED